MNNIHKDENLFCQTYTSTQKKGCIIFLHTFGIVTKCAIFSFVWWQIVQLFHTKKNATG
jgi:hypothetical protein